MLENFGKIFTNFYENNILEYLQTLYQYPIKLVLLVIDITLVGFLAVKLLKIAKDTRTWQLLKGIILLVIAMGLSAVFELKILNYILTSIMTYGVLILIVIFQPELRRGLEQLGSNKISKFFGLDKDIETKTKENIYKIAIAATEMAKTKTGALIVLEREIKIKDIIDTGILIDAEISPQLLVNIFVPNTPLHDGAVIISENKITAAACMLPLASDKDIAKELGTRHRAAIGISKESDAIAIVVSEETGKISVAKDGTLIADLKEEALKKILMKNLILPKIEKSGVAKISNFKNKTKKTKEEN
ncbi:MAG: diadenylate cyclase CdaA [Clostridia bacterium]|nr:diadenylate cyclase CdaA [Clostridia bacterium]